MRTGFLLASLLLGAAFVAVAEPASATCVTYAADSRVCLDATVGTPTVANDGEQCIDAVCPRVEPNAEACFYWVHSGQPLTPHCP